MSHEGMGNFIYFQFCARHRGKQFYCDKESDKPIVSDVLFSACLQLALYIRIRMKKKF